jgi:tyrosyl-tRNA synthetase
VLDSERIEVRRNSEWLEMGSDEMFRLVRQFTVARLLERDDFERRMEEDRPVSALELLYPILQGYDSVAVRSDVELGGTDQKFNLLFARDVQGAFGVPQQSVVTMPILPGTDGVRRMSKSLGNYVGVSEEPAEMFGKVMSVPDEVMGAYYELLLGEAPPEVENPMEAKRELARRLVGWFHDAGAAREAERRFDQVHVERGVPDEMPEIELDGAEVHLPAVIADHFGISRSEARRLVAQGGVRVGGEAVGEDRLDLPARELDGAVLQVGKRRFARLRAGS